MKKSNRKPETLPDPVKSPISHAIAKRRLNPRLTEADIEAVAQLVGKRRFTQEEACAHLNIKFDTFRGWLCRNAGTPQFSHMVTRARTASLERMLSSVEEAATVGDERGRKDWRAAWTLASRVLVDDGRFDERKAEQANGPSVDIAGLLQAAAKVYCPPAPQPAALPEITVAELPAPKTAPQV